MLRNASLLTLFSIVIACSSPQKTEQASFQKKFNSLEVGQTTEQVRSQLGEPSLREVINGKEIWHYHSESRKVEFTDKKLTGFSQERLDGDDSSSALGQDLKIGQSCKVDSQCHTGNCHFNKCVGPGNCSVELGGVCSSDQECCGGFCDFAVCKKKL